MLARFDGYPEKATIFRKYQNYLKRALNRKITNFFCQSLFLRQEKVLYRQFIIFYHDFSRIFVDGMRTGKADLQ